MIIQSLVNYYDNLASRGEISRHGWCMEKVSYALNISLDGELLGVIPTLQEVQRGKKTVEIPKIIEVPERVVRSSGIKANFLCDITSYILGFDEKGKPERAVECFAASKALHLDILKNAVSPATTAVKSFFIKWEPEKAYEHPILQPYKKNMATANIFFKINGEIDAQSDNEIQECWQTYKNQTENETKQICLITGKNEPIVTLHGKIKGVPGAQSAGANLVSYNASSYESYGKDGNNTAPIGEYSAFAYVTALNRLLADNNHSRRIGDTIVVYWAEDADPKPQQIFTLFNFPEPETDFELDSIMSKLSLGKPIEDIDMNKRFYILGLAPNAARISVRFFLQSTFGKLIENVQQHYLRLEINKPAFDNRIYLSVPALLKETVNPKSKDKASSPLLSGAVMYSVLDGNKYPESLFSAVIIRIRADGNVSRGRAAIIKSYLIKNHHEKEVTTMSLNESTDNRAYVLGRLFAVLEDAQLQANPGINATIKDRYFTSACATPGSVFPQLLKLSTFHTSKAEYGKSLEIEKTKLLGKLDVERDPLPTHHSLQEQGIFILGYYHQVQYRYTKKEDKNNDSDK